MQSKERCKDQELIQSSTTPIAVQLLIWRSAVCTLSFDGLKSHLLKKCFSDLNLYEAVTSSDLVVKLTFKFLLIKPLKLSSGLTHIYDLLEFELK